MEVSIAMSLRTLFHGTPVTVTVTR